MIAIGAGVPSIWTLGQRVGVGRLGGYCNECNECNECRQGRFQLCVNQPIVGSTCDGGYAEMMIARGTALIAIPDELNSDEAAPILCAGIATFNALKKCGAEAGDLVAVHGIGGLGHMALQYARRMGFKVAAIGRGMEIAGAACALGAHVYIDAATGDAVEKLLGMGGAKAILTTVGDADSVSPMVRALVPGGRLIVLSAGKDPLRVATGPLVVGERHVLGSYVGTPYETERALAFSVLADVRPRIEAMPLERAADAYRKVRTGDSEFRMVLTMSNARRAE